MKLEQDLDSSESSQQLEELSATVRAIAQEYQGDISRLLSLLRTLEHLHREIREQLFEPSLPNSRSQLYPLLKDIEESGGWPYIERMRLQTILNFLEESSQGEKEG
jgi:hypothetical protein